MTGTAVPLHCFYCGEEIQPDHETRYWLPDGPIHKVCYERRLSATDPGSIVLRSEDVQALRDVLTECANDLAAYVENEYPEASRVAHPSIVDRRYQRDIEPVNRARTALAILQSKEPKT